MRSFPGITQRIRNVKSILAACVMRGGVLAWSHSFFLLLTTEFHKENHTDSHVNQNTADLGYIARGPSRVVAAEKIWTWPS